MSDDKLIKVEDSKSEVTVEEGGCGIKTVSVKKVKEVTDKTPMEDSTDCEKGQENNCSSGAEPTDCEGVID